MLGQNFCEAPNFLESVVERRGGNADHVRLTEIAFYVRPLELVKAARLPAGADMKYLG
jgi:predicted nucleic acid-binding Zn finger protein